MVGRRVVGGQEDMIIDVGAELAAQGGSDDGLDRDFNPHETDVDGARGLYASMHRQGCPVIHSEQLGGFYLTASHPETRKAAADWRTYSSAAGVTLPKRPFKSAALEYDPPEHGFWRDLFKEVLNLATYREFEAKITEHAGELIAEFAPRGRADLATELGEILPVMTICEIVGVHDRERALLAREIALEVMASFGDADASARARERYVGFCMEEIDDRRRHPREDFLTRLGTAEVAPGRMLADDEIVSLLTGFLVAGHHTTSSLLAGVFQRVAADPELRDGLIADPTLISAAIEETLRLDTPLHGFFRRTTSATTFADVPIASGSEVMLNYAAANRDPAVFGCPEDFDLGRKPNPHLAFGFGIHSCPGSQLARLEARVVLEELLRRLPDLTADEEPVEIDWLGANLALIPRVPVTFTPA